MIDIEKLWAERRAENRKLTAHLTEEKVRAALNRSEELRKKLKEPTDEIPR